MDFQTRCVHVPADTAHCEPIQVNQRIYYPAALGGYTDAGADSGYVCIETPLNGNPSLCSKSTTAGLLYDGWFSVGTAGSTNAAQGFGYADPATSRLYSRGRNSNIVYCLDASNPRSLRLCPGFPFASTVDNNNAMRITLFPGTTQILLSGGTYADCYDTSRQARCAGWTGIVSAPRDTGEGIPIMNTHGVATGFCLWAGQTTNCYSAVTGAPITDTTDPINKAQLAFIANSNSNVGNAHELGHPWYNHNAFLGAKTYIKQGSHSQYWDRFYCWDPVTLASCPNYPWEQRALDLRVYGTDVDPNNPGCQCLSIARNHLTPA